MDKKKLPRSLKMAIQGLPLAGVLVTALLPVIQRIGQPLLVLMVLLWMQVFFIVECILSGR